MIFLIGVATGGIISGMLSDKFGRKKMLFISAVFQSFFGKYLSRPTLSFGWLKLSTGLALYFVESFEIYLVLRALLGIASVSVTYSGLILAIEYVDGVWRTIAGMYNLFPLPLSYIMISGIAYLTQDYKSLQLCIGLPGVFLCLLWYVILVCLFVRYSLRHISGRSRRQSTCGSRHKFSFFFSHRKIRKFIFSSKISGKGFSREDNVLSIRCRKFFR